MTVVASTGTAGIVSPAAADEACGGMTEMAIQSGRDVSAMLTGGRNPMAGRATVHDACMIEHRADESTGGMTDPAILVC